MPSNEERREIAAKWRKKYSERHGMFEPQSVSIQAMNRLDDLLDCLPRRHDMFLDLADLIEPEPKRTCELEPSKSGKKRCKCCGAFVSVDAVWDCCGIIPAKYCPNCGAKVVE